MANILNVEKTGVAIGQLSTGTELTKLFEVAYPTTFSSTYTGLNTTLSSTWIPLTLANSFTASTSGQWQYRGAGYRVEGKHKVIVAVSVAGTPSSDSITIAGTIPEDYRPAYTVFSLNVLNVTAESAAYAARLYVLTNGKVGLSWVCTGTSSTVSTDAISHINGLVEYWV